jgi:hypothetical protein
MRTRDGHTHMCVQVFTNIGTMELFYTTGEVVVW